MDAPAGQSLAGLLAGDTAERAGVLEVRYNGETFAAGGLAGAGLERLPISGLCYDSRAVRPGSLFFALPGLHTDGRRFVQAALEGGAAAVVCEGEMEAYKSGAAYIKVKSSRFAMSPLAAAFHGFPSERLAVIGVTGTEGKSTTVYLIYQLLTLMGKRAGFISTVKLGDGLTEKWNAEHQTTPEAVTVQALLAEMAANGAEYAVVEASSHGLSPRTNRLGDAAFDAGVVTNVTHEHLEFHGTWEQYRSDKAALFRALRGLPPKILRGEALPRFGVINLDDGSSPYFQAEGPSRVLTYSTTGADATLRVNHVESRREGNSYEAFLPDGSVLPITDNLPGAFNAGNVLAALLAASGITGRPLRDLAPLVPRLTPVKGRMTAVNEGQDFEVLVDYAHTPSSFLAVLPPLARRASGRLIVLFGSAGERDTQKRPEQGRIASAYAAIVILTDEDPRGEDPLSILEDIAKGITNKTRGESLFLIPSRPEAIRKAFSLARPGDIVLLLGKGHENSIIYGSTPTPYDEIREAQLALKALPLGGL